MGGGLWGSMAQHRTHQRPPPCSARSVVTDGQLWDRRGGGGAYVEEAADGADHEAGLVEARDAREGVASGATEEVCAKELHVGHGEELFGVKDAISLAMSEV